MRVGVFGYDLKFIRPIVGELETNHSVVVRTVESGSLHAFPIEAVSDLVSWADVIVCEFFGPYAERLTSMTRPDQPVMVRLHRFELHRGFADAVEPGLVSRVVCVNDFYASALAARSAFPMSAITVIPNAIDTDAFDRPKDQAASLTVGFLGASSQRKRLDLALDVIEEVRGDVPDAVLSIKSEHPENLKWVMDDPAERAYFEAVRPRLDEASAAGAVLWNPHGSDVAEWFQSVGFTLSTSDDESFHMAPAEGMASGTVPVVRHWPGAETVYDDRWLYDETSEAADVIARFMTRIEVREEASTEARAQCERFALPTVGSQWYRTLVELVSGAGAGP